MGLCRETSNTTSRTKGVQERIMTDLDRFFNSLREDNLSARAFQWSEASAKISKLIEKGIKASEKRFVFMKIENYFGRDKDIRILDFGCGGGQLVYYLYFSGYKRAYGVDVAPQIENVLFARKLGIGEVLFFEYDRKTLPFKDESFDLVVSEQVMEHVFDIEGYYRETARVLRNGGLAYLSFPHRLIPYDSHSKTWFIHLFPERIRRRLYKLLGRDPIYLAKILNFRMLGYHKKIASRYFTQVLDETKERLIAFDDQDLSRYEGNIRLRKIINNIFKYKVSCCIVKILAKLSNVDLCLVK
jgi:SAM-dependent methyltransferase